MYFCNRVIWQSENRDKLIAIYIRKQHMRHVYTSVLYGSIENILLKK